MSHFSEADDHKQLSMSQLMTGRAQHGRDSGKPFEVDRLLLDEDSSTCLEPASASNDYGLGRAALVGREIHCSGDKAGPSSTGSEAGQQRHVEAQALPAEYRQLQDMLCPVCGAQCQGDLQRLNSHVDVCLRKQELHGLIQMAALKKRCQTSTSMTSSASKKKALRPSSSGRRDITSFFKPCDDKIIKGNGDDC